MASKVDDALLFVICTGVICDSDKCELAGNGCAFYKTDRKILADIARRRYEKREKTPKLEKYMRIINKAFPRGAKVV